MFQQMFTSSRDGPEKITETRVEMKQPNNTTLLHIRCVFLDDVVLSSYILSSRALFL